MESRQKPNHYESLRHKGVVGSVVSRDYRTRTIYDRAGLGFIAYVGELEPGRWGYGYKIYTPDGIDITRLPGEDPAWFESERDALIYATAHLRNHPEATPDVIYNANNILSDLLSTSLFEI